MCGIAGFIGFNDNIALAHQANIIQKHRGPDNQSIWNDDYIALAHQRLSIIDLSAEANQPMHKCDLVIIFNGEIYNYKELKSLLIANKQATFNTTSDTEVVLEMYKHYGAKCLDMFIGMFAFAVYNKNTSHLFIARDHFGIKPLFYTQINDAFAFSSELKTLIQIPGFNKSINSKALVSSLNYVWISGNDTMFLNTYKLPAAHYLSYTKEEGLSICRYWDINDQEITSTSTEADLVQHMGKEIKKSVKRHMIADVPISSFLSGGLDSSLICAIASKINGNLLTYTIGTDNKDKKVEQMPDDEKFAKLVATKFNLENHTIKINADIIKNLPHLVAMLDEPIGDPSVMLTYLMCLEAKENGAKVILSGMGADEIFFGYRRQNATLLALKYSKLPEPIKSVVSKIVNNLPVKILGVGFKFGRWAKRFLSIADLPLDEAYMRSYSYYNSKQLKMLLKKDYWEGISAIKKEHHDIFYSKYKNDNINRICNTDLNMFMLGLNLTTTDRASMAASVEVRVPYIDKIIISEAMKIPGKLKIKKGQAKYILKKTAENILPHNIIYRRKASFGAPIRSWISSDLRSLVDDLLSEKRVNERGLLNFHVVKKMIDNDRGGGEDNAYQIYQLITLELWCMKYLDTPTLSH